MFPLMPSTKIAQMVLLRRQRGSWAIDKKYLQMNSPKPLFQNKKKIQRNGPHVALYQNWSEGPAWLSSRATRAKNRNTFKSL